MYSLAAREAAEIGISKRQESPRRVRQKGVLQGTPSKHLDTSCLYSTRTWDVRTMHTAKLGRGSFCRSPFSKLGLSCSMSPA